MVSLIENASVSDRSMPVANREYRLEMRPSSPQPLIVESHSRCRYQGLKTFESCDYAAQAPADFRITLERNARLIAQASAVLTMLGKSVADFGSMIVLTDATGIILRTQ